MLHACVQKFNVTGTVDNFFLELRLCLDLWKTGRKGHIKHCSTL